jgi:hypothetical protein
MSRMLPACYDQSTVSAAERRVFDLLKNDPATQGWVVIHSLGLARRGKKPYGEIDFVVLVPENGIFCLEVKGGGVACNNGEWTTLNRQGKVERLKRSPFLQAREGMFALRDSLHRRAAVDFPRDLLYGYAVVMPDVLFDVSSPEWEPWQAIDRAAMRQALSTALLRLAHEQRRFHPGSPQGEPSAASMKAIQQLLRPDFEVVVSRGAQIEETEARLLRLTEEQFDVLDLLSENRQCLLEGPAGTGKTMMALEYARRSAATGMRTLFVCFNRLLGDWLERQAADDPYRGNLTVGRYYKLLREVIARSSAAREFFEHEQQGEADTLYDIVYPRCGREALCERNQPYDVLVMDEAQDLLSPGAADVLDVWLNGGLGGGHWAIFGDFQRQAIFRPITGDSLRALLQDRAPRLVRGRLTMNCRNTRNIGEETALLSGFSSLPYRMGQVVGLPVNYLYYNSVASQCTALVDTISSLLNEGVRPEDIIVMSHLRLSNSGLVGAEGGNRFRLVDVWDNTPPSGARMPLIRFATTQAFKGMESPVVILCDVEQVGDGAPQSLLYVAMSRARSQLTVMVNELAQPHIRECIRRRLQEGWSGRP